MSARRSAARSSGIALAAVLALAGGGGALLSSTTRAQDPSTSGSAPGATPRLASLVGKPVVVVTSGPTTVEMSLTIDALEPAGVWASEISLVNSGTLTVPADVNEYRYFLPWSTISSIKVKR